MTDPKGDRGKRPKEQADPDLYLRVVERKSDGVVVRGAKFHQTGLLNSHEVLVMPTVRLGAGEEDWAICFALPTNAVGLHFIYGRQASDTRKLEKPPLDVGNPSFGGQEVVLVFDDVFVPDERIFLNGELDQTGKLVERFAAYRRQSYGGCKVGVGDILIGATALIARMNGVANASHVRDKLVEMIHLNETLFACGIACSAQGHPTLAGPSEHSLGIALNLPASLPGPASSLSEEHLASAWPQFFLHSMPDVFYCPAVINQMPESVIHSNLRSLSRPEVAPTGGPTN